MTYTSSSPPSTTRSCAPNSRASSRTGKYLHLIDLILDGGAGVLSPVYQPEWFPGDSLLDPLRPKGLPIGNLTSQTWANIYLDSLDQFVKRDLKCKGYVRYCDDFLLFHDDKERLHAWKEAVQEHLNALRLQLNWRRSTVYPTRTGIPFLGFRIFPTHRRLRSDNVRSGPPAPARQP